MQTENVLNTENKVENKVETSKVVTTKKPKVVKEKKEKEVKTATKLNLSKYKDLQIADKQIKEKELLYKYPEGFKKGDLKAEKAFRAKQRNNLDRLTNNILFFAKNQKEDEVRKAVKEFDSWYKTTLLVNDYSLKSVTNRNDEKTASIVKALEIIKIVKNQK